MRIKNHKAKKPSQQMVERYRHIPPGKNVLAAPRKHWPPRFRRKGYHYYSTSITRRLDYDKQAPTVLAQTGSDAEFIHPRFHRLLSLRERARLQTFPDDYEFVGSYASVHCQIGNAVPVEMARKLAMVLRQW